jgi:hypothetical protein
MFEIDNCTDRMDASAPAVAAMDGAGGPGLRGGLPPIVGSDQSMLVRRKERRRYLSEIR